MRLYLFLYQYDDPDCGYTTDKIVVVFAESLEEAREMTPPPDHDRVVCREYQIRRGVANIINTWYYAKGRWMTQEEYDKFWEEEWEHG